MQQPKHAAELHKAVKQDQIQQLKQKALDNPEQFVQMATDRGYQLEPDNLESQIDQMSETELTALINPGVGSRQRIIPR